MFVLGLYLDATHASDGTMPCRVKTVGLPHCTVACRAQLQLQVHATCQQYGSITHFRSDGRPRGG